VTATRRIGLLGGSFDPIHIGHLIMAESAREQNKLELVIFAPAGNPPHKSSRRLVPIKDRIAMIELAIASHANFLCSRIDAEPSEPSYTWRLLESVHEEFPDSDISFIMGGDSLREFGSWARPERILELASMAVIDRPGSEVDQSVRDAVPGLAEATTPVDAPMCSISSTEIRERVEERRSIRFLVPEPVREYIERRGLYRQ